MAGRIEKLLAEKGIVLPQVTPPRGNYTPCVVALGQAHVAGQVCFWNGELKFTGKVGSDLTLEQGQQAARLCALNILAQLKIALGDLDRVVRAVRLNGFVNATPDFKDHPLVINGASDLMVEVFGDAGRHARSAVGCVSLPLNTAVEVDGTFEIG